MSDSSFLLSFSVIFVSRLHFLCRTGSSYMIQLKLLCSKTAYMRNWKQKKKYRGQEERKNLALISACVSWIFHSHRLYIWLTLCTNNLDAIFENVLETRYLTQDKHIVYDQCKSILPFVLWKDDRKDRCDFIMFREKVSCPLPDNNPDGAALEYGRKRHRRRQHRPVLQW